MKDYLIFFPLYPVFKRHRNADKNTLLYRALTTRLESTYYVSGWNTHLIRDAQSRLDTGTRVVLNAIFSEPRVVLCNLSVQFTGGDSAGEIEKLSRPIHGCF